MLIETAGSKQKKEVALRESSATLQTNLKNCNCSLQLTVGPGMPACHQDKALLLKENA